MWSWWSFFFGGEDGGVEAAPSAPANLAGTPGPGSVTWSWDAASGATIYTLKWGTALGGPYPNSSTTPGLSIEIGGLDIDTYYAVVTASNTGGESSASSEASADVTEARSGSGRGRRRRRGRGRWF